MTRTPDPTLRRIFVVINPESLVQPAFERAEWIAARTGAVLTLYCCIGENGTGADDPAAQFAVERTTRWLQRFADWARDYELETEVQVEWNSAWRDRLPVAARESQADLVVKTVSRHSGLGRQLRQTADWALLRKVHCPTLLIDPQRPPQPRKVLAAVKLKPDTSQYEILNHKVVAMAHRVATALEGELHAVTVYRGDDMYFDRQRFADSCGLPRNRVHSIEASPHKGIARVAEQIGADILVIGRAHAAGDEGGSMIGDTAERIIDDIDLDLVVVPAL
jgi:nucleotide-binding universal stress UspA family protein